MSIGALLTAIANNAGGLEGDPSDYGSNLLFWLESEQGVNQGGTGSGGLPEVVSWLDQSDNSNLFTVPSAPLVTRPPELEANSVNGLPGITFQESPTAQDRKLSSNAITFDSIFAGLSNTFVSIGFAARIDTLASSNTSANNTILSKGFQQGNGWVLDVVRDGTMRFRKRRSDGSIFNFSANGFYASLNLVVGVFTWNGTTATDSANFRLWDGTQFVNVGSVLNPGSGSIGGADNFDMVVGNTVNTANGQENAHAAFHGSIFSLWATKPGLTTFDDSYLLKYT
ncbi:MAG: hypothetical protein ACR2RE_16610 [Geminicoccaceae bacterium]